MDELWRDVRVRTLLLLTTVGVVVAAIVGCPRSQNTSISQSRQMMRRMNDRGEGLLSSAVAQLQNLPSYVETDLRPPVVLLDSTKSGNGEDVLAIATTNPDVPDGPINFIRVPAGNSRFRTLGIKPGDILKYYVLLDEDSLVTGIAQEVAMELRVAQVPSEDTVLIEGGLSAEVLQPTKIEVWRYVDDRLIEIMRQLLRYRDRRPPPIGWEPSPDEQMLSQIVVRLNQWLRQNEPKTDWQSDPTVATLDQELVNDKQLAPYVSPEALSQPYFAPYDGRLMQEAVWLRDISRWARGDSFDAVERAEALFDWTVRNVQLDGEAGPLPHRPWQTLLYGHGTAAERAWVFAQLCRQQGLDVVMIKTAEGGEPSAEGQNSSASSYWQPALVHDGELFLFDPRLGLPVPGPDGEGVATLAEAAADDAVLRQLDLEGAPYRLAADQLKQVEAYIVVDPFSLSRRADQLESTLSGDDRIALSARPREVAERLKSIDGIASVKLWDVPFRTLRDQLSIATSAQQRSARIEELLAFEPFAYRPKLWKARSLHFQGRREFAAKPDDSSRDPRTDEVVDDHREAGRLYLDPDVRPPDRIISAAPEQQRRGDIAAKLEATYWVGLLLFDDGKYESAADWFSRPELSSTSSTWATGARYNLARTYEAQGKFDEAIALYEEGDSPQQHGNRLRAKWLTARPKETVEEPAADENAER